MIDFCNEHGDKTTNEDFNKAWKSIGDEKLKARPFLLIYFKLTTDVALGLSGSCQCPKG
jgi:hypothetical protein